MCGKQRVCGRVILYVWQLKELSAHFAEVSQIKDLRESGVDSKGFAVEVADVFLEVWILKELAGTMVESKGVAGAVASDNVAHLGDSPEVWQAKGLEREGQKSGESALTGRAGSGTIPPDIPIL
jgi:hypothetical protein